MRIRDGRVTYNVGAKNADFPISIGISILVEHRVSDMKRRKFFLFATHFGKVCMHIKEL